MADADVVLEEPGPNGNIMAVVEQDERVAFFYLFTAPDVEWGMRSCWVRNLRSAPSTLAVEDMLEGRPPMLPAKSCTHPDGAKPLELEHLRVVWFEEGDGAALLENDQVLAIIPWWGGEAGFQGYARDCIFESELCWPLGSRDENALYERVERADQWWQQWNQDDDPWRQLQPMILDCYEKQLGKESNYYAIDGDQWPPRGMVRIPHDAGTILATVGMSLRPMPRMPGHDGPNPPATRVELALALGAEFSDTEVINAGQYLSGQAGYPWAFYTWFGEGHTLPCSWVPNAGTEFPWALITKQPAGRSPIELPMYRDDTIELLWLVPITEHERQWAVDQSSSLLLEKLQQANVGWVFHHRDEVALE